MFETLFTVDGWRSIAFVFQILVWVLGVIAVLFQIIVFVAKANVDTLKAAPRTIDNPAALYPHMKVKSPPISIISFGNGEPEAYAAEIIAALRSTDFDVKPPMHVGFNQAASSGLTVVPNGQDASQLMKSLDQAKIKYTLGKNHHVPASARQFISDSIVLEVGAK